VNDSLEKEIAALLKHSERLKQEAAKVQERADEVTRKLAAILRRRLEQQKKR
jgi:hypothetical protein